MINYETILNIAESIRTKASSGYALEDIKSIIEGLKPQASDNKELSLIKTSCLGAFNSFLGQNNIQSLNYIAKNNLLFLDKIAEKLETFAFEGISRNKIDISQYETIIFDADQTIWDGTPAFKMEPPFSRIDEQAIMDSQEQVVKLKDGLQEVLLKLRASGKNIGLISHSEKKGVPQEEQPVILLLKMFGLLEFFNQGIVIATSQFPKSIFMPRGGNVLFIDDKDFNLEDVQKHTQADVADIDEVEYSGDKTAGSRLVDKAERNGWLSPDGKFYECDYSWHESTAEEILENLKLNEDNEFIDEDGNYYSDSVNILENLGWGHLSGNEWALRVWGRHQITQKQLDFVYDWYDKQNPNSKEDFERFLKVVNNNVYGEKLNSWYKKSNNDSIFYKEPERDGWLSPDGKFYKCPGCQKHEFLAGEILKNLGFKFNNERDKDGYKYIDTVDILENLGWGHLAFSEWMTYVWEKKPITQKQLDFVYDWYNNLAITLDPEKEFEEFLGKIGNNVYGKGNEWYKESKIKKVNWYLEAKSDNYVPVGKRPEKPKGDNLELDHIKSKREYKGKDPDNKSNLQWIPKEDHKEKSKKNGDFRAGGEDKQKQEKSKGKKNYHNYQSNAAQEKIKKEKKEHGEKGFSALQRERALKRWHSSINFNLLYKTAAEFSGDTYVARTVAVRDAFRQNMDAAQKLIQNEILFKEFAEREYDFSTSIIDRAIHMFPGMNIKSVAEKIAREIIFPQVVKFLKIIAQEEVIQPEIIQEILDPNQVAIDKE